MQILLAMKYEGAAQFATVLLIFLFVLAVTYFTTRFIGNYQKARNFNRNFETLEVFRVTNNKFLQLIRVGKRYFIISIGKDSVELISEINEEDIDLSANDDNTGDKFMELFENAKNKLTKRSDK